MSYPPRPPMMQNPYGYGMQSMGMNMMNASPMMGNHGGQSRPQSNQPPPPHSSLSLDNTKPQTERPPTTTVFVGNISEKAPDPMIRSMLQRCGTVINWKRVQGANGKLQAFGFCEYDNPEATLRCIRLLNDYEISEKKLTVKVDQKTKELLGEHIRNKKKLNEPKTQNAKKAALMRSNLMNKRKLIEDGEIDDHSGESKDAAPGVPTAQPPPPPINLETVDEDTLKEDRMVIGQLETILRQYNKELTAQPHQQPPTTAPPPATSTSIQAAPKLNIPSTTEPDTTTSTDAPQTTDSPTAPSGGVYMKAHLRLEEIQLDADKKELITSEIQIFREKHKNEDVKIKKEEKERMERVVERERLDKERRLQRQQQEAAPTRSRSKDRHHRSKSKESDQQRRRNVSPHTDTQRQRSTSRTRRTSRTRQRSNERLSRDYKENRAPASSSSSTLNLASSSSSLAVNPNEDPEEAHERRKLERKLREKELAYRERLKIWEQRESKRRREYLMEKKKEMHRRKTHIKEGKKLKQFLEDYDDEKDDSNYYKGSNLAKRLKLREKEIEMDDRDRQREKEELDELKRKLIDQGKIDAEIEAKRIQDEENAKMKIKFDTSTTSSSSSSSSSESELSDNEVENNNNNKQDLAINYENFHKNNNNNNNHNSYNGNNKTNSYSNNSHHYTQSHHRQQDNSHEDLQSMEKNQNLTNELLNEKQLINSPSNDSKELDSDFKFNNEDSNAGLLTPANLSDDASIQLDSNVQIQQMDSCSISPQSNQSPYQDTQSSSINFNLTSSNGSLTTQPTTTVTIKKQMLKTKSSIQPINQIFADEEDDEQSNAPNSKRAKLTSLQQQSLSSASLKASAATQSLNADERKKAVKKIIESIPTDRAELFNFQIDWDQLDQSLMDKRIKPWVNRKIIEYIGEEEASLNDFICSKIIQKIQPDKILEDVKVILDDEAELFVKKMWRLIIYETESKRLGLSK